MTTTSDLSGFFRDVITTASTPLLPSKDRQRIQRDGACDHLILSLAVHLCRGPIKEKLVLTYGGYVLIAGRGFNGALFTLQEQGDRATAREVTEAACRRDPNNLYCISLDDTCIACMEGWEALRMVGSLPMTRRDECTECNGTGERDGYHCDCWAPVDEEECH